MCTMLSASDLKVADEADKIRIQRKERDGQGEDREEVGEREVHERGGRRIGRGERWGLATTTLWGKVMPLLII